MKIGYARTSTVDQQAGLDAQLSELKRLGCDKVFSEQVSSVAHRDQASRAWKVIWRELRLGARFTPITRRPMRPPRPPR